MTKTKRNTLDDVDLKPLEVYTLFDSVLPTDTGIYAIVNVTNGKFYIGSTKANGSIPSLKGFRSRFTRHRNDLLNNDHHCKYLQRCFNKTISDNLDPNSIYQVWILEYVERDLCLELEQCYLDTYKPTYNGTLLARCGGHERTPKMRERSSQVKSIIEYIGVSPSGEVFNFRSAPKFAKKYNLVKAHIYRCAKGVDIYHKRWRFFYKDDPAITEEYLRSVVKDQKSKYRIYIAISPKGEIFEFDDVYTFAKLHNLRSERITECADRVRLTHKGWHIYYLNDPDLTREHLEKLTKDKSFRFLLPSKYIAISPYGELFYFDNEYDFAREHNLVQSGINKCMVGKADHYKNWKFYYSYDERLTPEFLDSVIKEQQITIRREYVGVSPSGEIFFFDNAAEFARDNNLLNACISKCVLGQADTHEGWHFYFAQNVTDDFLQSLASSKLIPKYVAISPQGEKVYFNSMADFAEGTEFSRNSISQCVNGRLKTHRGWMFMEYKDELAA